MTPPRAGTCEPSWGSQPKLPGHAGTMASNPGISAPPPTPGPRRRALFPFPPRSSPPHPRPGSRRPRSLLAGCAWHLRAGRVHDDVGQLHDGDAAHSGEAPDRGLEDVVRVRLARLPLRGERGPRLPLHGRRRLRPTSALPVSRRHRAAVGRGVRPARPDRARVRHERGILARDAAADGLLLERPHRRPREPRARGDRRGALGDGGQHREGAAARREN